MTHFSHSTWLAIVFGAIGINLALAIEANESQVYGIKKQEFVRVMGNVVKASQQSEQQVQASKKPSQREPVVQRNSLHFLREANERRKKERKLKWGKGVDLSPRESTSHETKLHLLS